MPKVCLAAIESPLLTALSLVVIINEPYVNSAAAIESETGFNTRHTGIVAVVHESSFVDPLIEPGRDR